MAYRGLAYKIPLGTQGMSTDDTQDRMNPASLLEARNIDFYYNTCATEGGSRRWNASALGTGIRAFHDFWPSDVVQRVTVFGSDSRVYKFIDSKQSVVINAASTTDTQSLAAVTGDQPMFVQGGAVNGEERKLFLFTGGSPVQVMTGDFTTRSDIARPAADWSGSNQPTAGCIHAGRLAAWGNANFPHMLYLSSATDHEDFQTNGAVLFFPIFPGEGERLMGGFNYKGRLFLFKYPRGVYYLDDSDPDVTNWAVRKISSEFGAASSFSFIEALDDFFVANAQGSISSFQATLNFGSMTAGNLLRMLRNEGYMRRTVNRSAHNKRYGIWYEEKKTAYFAYQSSGGTQNDLLLKIDFNDQATPKVSWTDKDRPNCLGLMKDSLQLMRPFYGSLDGYLYRLDSDTYDVGGSSYTSSFKTINLDFGAANDPQQGEREKLYDFLEITYEPCGAWNVSIDVYIDNAFSETITAQLTRSQYLGNMNLGPTGSAVVLGRSPQSIRIPLHGRGRRIAFKVSVSGLRQRFKINELCVYYRPAGQDQEA